MISNNPDPEPRLQTRDYKECTPFFGVNVDGLAPDKSVTVDDTAYGYPLEHLNELPAGDYYVQAMLDVYTVFHRADGHIVKMHMDQWEGQQFQISPGNLYSDVQKLHLDAAAGADPGSGARIRLEMNNVVPAMKAPVDTDYVKHVKFKSELLSNFWGQPIYIGATVLLPKDYDVNKGIKYPVNYEQGHFSTDSPGHFRPEHSPAPPAADEAVGPGRPQEFGKEWLADKYPRMLYVTFQHPCPYYDDSYAVDSPSVGPYGQAITRELIPYIESHFRAIGKPYARILSGGSTGGWEALALQIFYPDYFGGAFAYCPDPVDFHFFQAVNIYDWPNAWYRKEGWIQVPVPGDRNIDGIVLSTMKQQLNYERARGDRGRSGEQWDMWQAVFGPVGADGYFKPLIDPETGAIDKEVAAYWRDHMDLTQYLKSHWSQIGQSLAGKIHIWVGDMDTYYLNDAVHLIEQTLNGTTSPPCGCSVVYGPRKPHCWPGPFTLAERIKIMAEYVAERSPKDEDPSWWRF
jgi:hypothetical protein